MKNASIEFYNTTVNKEPKGFHIGSTGAEWNQTDIVSLCQQVRRGQTWHFSIGDKKEKEKKRREAREKYCLQLTRGVWSGLMLPTAVSTGACLLVGALPGERRTTPGFLVCRDAHETNSREDVLHPLRNRYTHTSSSRAELLWRAAQSGFHVCSPEGHAALCTALGANEVSLLDSLPACNGDSRSPMLGGKMSMFSENGRTGPTYMWVVPSILASTFLERQTFFFLFL